MPVKIVNPILSSFILIVKRETLMAKVKKNCKLQLMSICMQRCKYVIDIFASCDLVLVIEIKEGILRTQISEREDMYIHYLVLLSNLTV